MAQDKKEQEVKPPCTHPKTYVAVRHAATGLSIVKCSTCNAILN